MKKRIALVLFISLLSLKLFSQTNHVSATTIIPDHPRILLLKGEEKMLKRNISKDIIWKDIQKSLIDEADQINTLPTNERIKTGIRLLAISRENLRRIFILSYAYRTTGNKKYAIRAEEEMLKAASFEDWNPSHFLDVGEMTMALAIGYDWLHPLLSDKSKDIIETAIIEKGIKPSYNKEYNWFVDAVHNWSQVCHAGITYGALAIWEKNPELASDAINRAITKIQTPMKCYAPDGGYPEGVDYWNYGTSFNAMFIAAIEKVFNTDFGLAQAPGFLKTGEYILHMVTPSLKNFAYSDNGINASLMPTMFWFYQKTQDPSILYNQVRLYQNNGHKMIKNDRLAPCILLWGASTQISNIPLPNSLLWQAQGENPVCAMRSSWEDTTGIYVGVKMGSPAINHGHMDAGSFILESDGIMWAMDMGSENYNKLETKGVRLWGSEQNAQRWDVFRYNNFAHNTLTFNNRKQQVKGKASIEHSSDLENNMFVKTDLTSLYSEQMNKVERTVTLKDKKYVIIEDKMVPGKQFTMLTWNLITPAEVEQISDNMLVLKKDGKELFLKVECPTKIKWSIDPAIPLYSFDSQNPGITMIRFNTDLILTEEQTIKVYLMPNEVVI